MEIIRTNAKHPDFITLVRLLDAYLTITDGEEHDFYDQYNQLDDIKYVVLAYENETAIGCGSIKSFDNQTMEIKRMYVSEDYRGKGIAGILLKELENWAGELKARRCILETGLKQTSAIRLYEKCGYRVIPNFEPYLEADNSVCMEKVVNKNS